jgi:hypothetical protein
MEKVARLRSLGGQGLQEIVQRPGIGGAEQRGVARSAR